MKRSLITLALLAGVAWAAPAIAVDSPDVDACMSRNATVSIPACTRIITGNAGPPDFIVEIHGARGLAYFNSGDYRHAIPDFDVLLLVRDDPKERATIYRLRGIAHYKVGEFDKAIEDLTASLAVPDAKGLVARALAYLREERYAEAFSDYTDALALQHDIPQALFGLGICEQWRGNKAAAARDFAAARKLDPDVARAFKADGIVPRP